MSLEIVMYFLGIAEGAWFGWLIFGGRGRS